MNKKEGIWTNALLFWLLGGVEVMKRKDLTQFYFPLTLKKLFAQNWAETKGKRMI